MNDIDNNSSNTLERLESFVDEAVGRRQYSASTAAGLKVALRLYARAFNQAERQSVKAILANLSGLDQAVATNNQTNYTAGTLEVYRKRFGKVVGDFSDYQAALHQKHMSQNTEMVRIEWPLGPGRQASLTLPANLTNLEIDRLKQLLDLQKTS